MADIPPPYLFVITEGWTEEIGPITLWVDRLVDGVVVTSRMDLTGLTVLPVICPKRSSTYSDMAGDLRIDADPTTGDVYLNPDAADFDASQSPYTFRFKVTDGAGKVAFWPNGAAHTVFVHKK